MQNPQILELIENLKGRRNYEEKKASKLGFNSLYAYFENKLLQFTALWNIVNLLLIEESGLTTTKERILFSSVNIQL